MERLRIAIQKSGRLNEGSMKLLKEAGVYISNSSGNTLKAVSSNFPVEVLFLRNSDIPQYVQDGVADIAVLGENEIMEREKNVRIIQKLDFSKCRLCLAVPKDEEYSGLSFFEGKKLATSYPNTLRAFLKKNGINAEIHEISGSVEIAPSIGLADGICDLVSSGNTLFTNGLKEVETILKSEAVIVASPNLSESKQAILDKLLFRIKSVLTAKNNKYVLLNAPNNRIEAISALLPGMRSPSVIPLAAEGWSSLHSVINENDFWEVIDKLKEAGAEGILVVPIEKMVI